MSYKVRFLTKEESIEYYGFSPYDDYSQDLGIFIDGELKQVESDHGEPEDNSFVRDWSWVPSALMEAYEKGIEDGREQDK